MKISVGFRRLAPRVRGRARNDVGTKPDEFRCRTQNSKSRGWCLRKKLRRTSVMIGEDMTKSRLQLVMSLAIPNELNLFRHNVRMLDAAQKFR